MDYTNRRRPREGTTKFYPPYDAMCCGYEVRRCPFTEMSDNSEQVRLSPVFVERLGGGEHPYVCLGTVAPIPGAHFHDGLDWFRWIELHVLLAGWRSFPAWGR